MWTVYGKPYYNDTDLTDTSVYQEMSFSRAVVLRAVRAWIVLYNDPTFTSLNMKIYTANNLLLHTSTNVQTKADLITLDYGVKETYFEFSDVDLAKDETYRFVLNASGYSGASETSHIAWKSSYPDPVYVPDDLTEQAISLPSYPLNIYPIFAGFDTP